jgi:multidrug efflux system membrane fusion protein
LGGVALVAIAAVAWGLFHRPPAKAAAPRAVPVSAAQAVRESIPLTLSALGSAQAWTSDTIFAQVSGKLISVGFREGGDVKAGQVLAQVDPAPFQAALTQAEGMLRRDQGVLAGARRDLTRFQHLLGQNAIAKQTVDDEAAAVAQDEGAVQLDQGVVAAARINLAYCRITSPISGRAGVRLVDPGNLVSASGSVASTPSTSSATSNAAAASSSTSGSGSSAAASGGGVGSNNNAGGTGIVVINQIQPIAVTFTVAEGDLQRLLAVTGGVDQPLAVMAYSQETGELLDQGQLEVIDNRVDPSTGTVELKARFPNAARRLWPGQFVNVKITLNTLPNATVIPNTAINRGPNGQFAFVIGRDRHVVARAVSVTGVEGGDAIIASGVRPGELVVVDGQMSLKNGSLVRVTQPPPKSSS